MAEPQDTDDDDDDDLEEEIRALLRAPPVEPDDLLERIAPARLPEGTRIDDAFVIERRIAQGGMGVVYQARHELLQRTVAIKLCRRRATEKQTERLLQEARAMAALDHPNVVKVHHVGMFDAQVYIAMEFVDGGTLGRWCTEEARSPAELVEMFVAAGRGLQAAHAQGFVHRDFKPENVLIGTDGRARVGDFGMVSASLTSTDDPGPSSSAQTTLSFAGTPHYMAPEQRAGEPVGPAADQYSLCLSLREALEDADKRNVRSGQTPTRNSARVQAALHRGMQRDPTQRYPDIGALLDALLPPRRSTSRVKALGIVTGLILVSAATWWAATPSVAACPPSEPLIKAVWNPDRAREVLAAAPDLATDHVRRLLTDGFDRFSGRWSDAHTQTCDAAALPTPALQTAARLCLLEARAQFDAALQTVVDSGPSGQVRAMQGLYALPKVAVCVDVATLQRRLAVPRSAEDTERASALRIELARIRAVVLMDVPHPDIARMDAAIAASEGLGDRSALALALLLRARSENPESTDPREATRRLERAFFEAEAAGDDRLRAEIGAYLVYVTGVDQGRRTEALDWASRTEAVVQRLGKQGLSEASGLYDSIGWLHLERGQFEEATVALEKAEQLKVEAFGPEHPSTASTRLTLGRLWIRRGQHARARAILEAAHEGYLQSGDLRHPGIPRTQLLLAELAEERTDDGEAQRLLLDVLSRWEADFGLEHPRLIRALNNLGRVRARIGDSDGALTAYGRAREIAVRSLGPDDAQTGWALGNEGEGFMAAGAHEAAIDSFTEAIVHMRAQPAREGLDNEALAGRAEAYVATGRIWAAREDAQRVLAQCEPGACEPGIVARASLAQAGALDQQGNREAAIALLSATLSETPSGRRTHQRWRRRMQRWLEERAP